MVRELSAGAVAPAGHDDVARRVLSELGAAATEPSGGGTDLAGALAERIAALTGAASALLWCLEPDGRLAPQPPSHGVADALLSDPPLLDLLRRHPEVLEAPTSIAPPEALARRLGAGPAGVLVAPWRAGERVFGAVTAWGGGLDAEEASPALELVGLVAGVIWQQRSVRDAGQAGIMAELDRLRAEAALARSLEQAKADFIQLAAHELRSPLAVINGYLELVEDERLTPERRAEILARVRHRAMDLSGLVEQLLLAARLDADALVMGTSDIDLRSVVEAVVRQTPYDPSQHRFRVEEPDEPVVVRGDASWLRTVLAKIVDNAMKYSPEGGEVTVTLGVTEGEALLTVSDDGLGVPREDLERIFTRFGRVVTPENRHIYGSGLGLYFCREVVRRHGGEIEVESEEGRGSTFRVRLPLAGETAGHS